MKNKKENKKITKENLQSKFSSTSNFTNFQLSANLGFTLIETLVAITILLISIVGPMTLAGQGMISSRLSKNQITAFYLAQEVVEHVRNVRDNNILSGAGNWINGLTDCTGAGSECQIDVTDNTIKSCGSQCDLLRKSSDGMYGYNPAWTETNFRRSIKVDVQDPENTNEIQVEVLVEWKGGTKTFLVREELFNF